MLAINTAFRQANLALEWQSKLELRDIDANSKHSENVLKTVDEMCEKCGADINEIDVFAMVIGPGSFTGLRISASMAQALAVANPKLRFVALTSFDLMAYVIDKNRLCDGDFMCVIDALSGLCFVCERRNGVLQEPKLVEIEEAKQSNLKKFCLKDDLKIGSQIEFDSEDLYRCALAKIEKNQFVSREQMLPLYLRRSQAEDNLLKKSEKD